MNELRRLGIPLPDSESEFIRRLSDHSRQRQEREGAFANPGDAEQLLATVDPRHPKLHTGRPRPERMKDG